MDESQLIQRIKSGDADACAEVVHKHYKRIYQMLVQLTRDSHRAEDLCQETFAAAWAKIDTFSQQCSLSTWLHRIAYRRYLDWARARKNRPSDPLLSEPIEPRDPLAEVLEDERQRSLLAGLEQLPAIDRHVLVLRYLQQLGFNEIAAIMEQPAATLRWRTSKALKRLREILESDEVDHVQKRRSKTGEGAESSAVAGDPRRS